MTVDLRDRELLKFKWKDKQNRSVTKASDSKAVVEETRQ